MSDLESVAHPCSPSGGLGGVVSDPRESQVQGGEHECFCSSSLFLPGLSIDWNIQCRLQTFVVK